MHVDFPLELGKRKKLNFGITMRYVEEELRPWKCTTVQNTYVPRPPGDMRRSKGKREEIDAYSTSNPRTERS